jgi:hypothetical protein
LVIVIKVGRGNLKRRNKERECHVSEYFVGVIHLRQLFVGNIIITFCAALEQQRQQQQRQRQQQQVR